MLELYLIVDGGYKDAAAVLAGGVLEQHLRKLCQKLGLPIDKQTNRGAEPLKAAALNDELHKNHAQSQHEWRSVQSWLDYRNAAAHGNYEKYDAEQIGHMVEGIRSFIVRYPA